MDVEARMALKPAPHGGVLVGRIIVGDQVDFEMRRGITVDLVQEPDELLVAVAPGALPQDPAGLDVERGEQGRRAVPGIIMRARRRMAGDQRQRLLAAPGSGSSHRPTGPRRGRAD